MAMTMRFPDDVNDGLRTQAQREGRSMQLVVCDAVREYVSNRAEDQHSDRVREASRRGAEKYREALRRLGRA